ncbi:HNH endonuclease [Enterococcus dongliensis]|uniref:HNH endonuclease n=1 Tax=Enterococcus dongliensis TaxID=2559925 RepID=UPI00288EC433|nr:HNH endonuclease [Enterococcus dongliensis]MDT2613515.1 HNH endonuclease [Enterococcus dongliensis]
MAVKKQCNHAGCKTLIDYRQKYCEKHKPATKQTEADRYENRKRTGGKYFQFYHSKEWKKASQLYKLNHPCCEDCLEEGIIRKTDVTDHVIELRDDWSKRLDESNYRSRCHYHHNLKTRQEKAKRATLNR